MFRNLFSPDSALMLTMTQITDCIFLSLFWLLGCFPVITAGASTAALYDATFRGIRRGEKHCWYRFFYSFRQNLKSSLVSTVLFLLVLGGMAWGGIKVWNAAVYGQVSWAVFAGVAFLLFVLTGHICILFPMLSRFENSTGRLWSNTFRLGFVNLPLTLGLAAVNLISAFLCLRFIFPLFFLPSLTALISSIFIEIMFRPYLMDDPT